MNSIRAIRELNKRELEAGISTSGSWHADYRDTAYIYIGGLPYNLTEGDIVTIFSQFGEPVHINLVRDKETGKSKGFAFLKYEDQRSTDLAVDNLGGAEIMGRTLRVDHTRYKKRDDEQVYDNTNGANGENVEPERRDRSESEEEERPMLKEEIELERIKRDHDDDDPMKQYLIEQKQEEVKKALENQSRKQRRREKESRSHRRRRRGDESESDEDREKRRQHKSREPDLNRRDHQSHRHDERSSRRHRDRSRSAESKERSDERNEQHRSHGRRGASPNDRKARGSSGR